MRSLTSREFKNVYSNGRKINSRFFTVFVLPAEAMAAGIAVSSKHGGAVVRNKIKRRIKGILRQIDIAFMGKIVIIPKVGIFTVTFEELSRELDSDLKKAEVVV